MELLQDHDLQQGVELSGTFTIKLPLPQKWCASLNIKSKNLGTPIYAGD
jgi:hypothetical protein